MLTAIQVQQQRRRPLPSLQQQYDEYILQRIENFKNGLSRHELMALGNEALAEMNAAREAQLTLTEMLMADEVDKLISRRLKLESYKKWSRKIKNLRAAQRTPMRWGLDPNGPLAKILPRLEPGDTAIVLGPDAEPVAGLLAAHEVHVTFLGDDMTHVDQVESRINDETLGHYCTTYVAPLGHFPCGVPDQVHIVVVDTRTLEGQTAANRRAVLETLMARTLPGGLHLIFPSKHALAPEAYLTHYGEWIREPGESRGRQPARSLGILLSRPPEPPGARPSAEAGSPAIPASRDVPA